MFDRLRQELNKSPEQQSALTQHLIFHETFKKGGYLDNGRDYDLRERDSLIRQSLRDLGRSSDDDFRDRLLDSFGDRSIYGEIDNESSIGKDPSYRLKGLIREVSNKAKGALDPGVSNEAIDDFVGTSLFKTLFESPYINTGEGYRRFEEGTAQRDLYDVLIGSSLEEDVDNFYRGGADSIQRRRGRASGGYEYNKETGYFKAATSLDRNVYNTRYELARLREKTFRQYSRQDSIDFLHDLIDSSGYINKPGIGVFAALIDSSQTSLDIDMFQFQNQVLADLYANKIIENSRRIAEGTFKVNIRLAGSDKGSKGITGFSILGPNKIQLERFAQIKEDLINAVTKDLIEQGNDPSTAFIQATENVNNNFQIQETDRKNHRKLLINESLSMIGSANLTSPVGSSIYQEGSTFESVRILERHEWADEYIEIQNLSSNNYLPSDRAERLRAEELNSRLGPNKFREEIISQMEREIISTKLYKQTAAVNEAIHRSKERLMSYGQRNIGLSHDIYLHLESTLEYAVNNQNSNLRLMLDQPYLLQFGQASWKGEMGIDSSLDTKDRQKKYRENIQDRLYELVRQDRAEVVVDIRNYREKVIDPLYKALDKGMGGIFEERYGRDLERLVDLNKSFTDREADLRSRLSSVDFGPDLSFDQAVKQIMVATSGNVILTTQAKQHIKSYGLFETSSDELISYYDGSSNLGPGSLALNLHDMAANEEIGLLLSKVDKRRRNLGANDLTQQEEIADLIASTRSFNNKWQTLTGRRKDRGLEKDSRAVWEKDVDTKQLERLASYFRQINEAVGQEVISINYMLGGSTGSKRVGLNVDINTGLISGLDKGPRINYRFTTLQHSPGSSESGYVLALNQGKAIGNSLFVNDSDQDISMPFGIGEGISKSKSSVVIDSVQSTASRIATLIGETAFKGQIAGPTSYLTQVYGEQAIADNFVNYLESLVGGRSDGARLESHSSIAEIELIKTKMRSSLINNDASMTRQITGTDGDMYERERIKVIDKVTTYLNILQDTYREDYVALSGSKEIDRNNILSQVSTFWRHQKIEIWQDLALDMMRAFNDFGYENYISGEIRETNKYLFEDTVTQGKQSRYGNSQGFLKMGLFGVTNSPQYEILRNRSKEKKTGLGKILDFARFVPLTYGPGNEVYSPGAFRSVAEGGGSRPSNDFISGITMFGMRRQEIGTIADASVVDYLGAGFSTNIDELRSYIRSQINDGSIDVDALIKERKYSNKRIVTYMFSPGKVSQIAQRMKNFMGAQPLQVINEEVARIMEEEARLSKSNDKRISLSEYLDDKVENLRSEVANALVRRGADQDQANKRAKDLIDDSYSYSFIMGGGVRKVMSDQAALVLEAERKDIEEELGLDSSNELDKALINKLLRARLVRRDVISPGIKGFIGHAEGKPQISLIQLGGLYTDTFQANPIYGGEGGQREGFVDRQEKRLKASMLSNNWTSDAGKIVAKSGSYVAIDEERKKVIIVEGVAGGLVAGSKVEIPIEAFSHMELERLSDYVDSMTMRPIFKEVADNQKGVTGESSFATYKASTWISEGEDSIEYMLSSKFLNADPETNQSVFEMMLIRSKKPGGGSRPEAAGALVKGPADFAEVEHIQDVLKKRKEARRDGVNPRSAIGDVDIHNVYGIMGPSQIKSYSFEHGTQLLSSRESIDITLGNRSDQIMMSLLMNFGTDFIKIREGSSGIDKIRNIKRLMYERAVSGEMGSYYKEMITAAVFNDKYEKTLKSILDSYKNTPHKGSADYINAQKEAAITVMTAGASYSLESTPGLIGLSADEVEQALRDGDASSTAVSKIRGFFNRAHSRINEVGYLRHTNMEERTAINMMAAIDLSLQLASAGELRDVKSDADLNDLKSLKQIASLSRGFDLARLDTDEDYRAEVRDILRPQLGNYRVIALYSSNTFSESKVPMGKKYEANLELQYMMKDFTGAFKSLRSGGSLSQIKKAVATIYKATSLIDELTVGSIESSIGDLGIMNFTDMEFTGYGSKKGMGKSRFLGVYGGTSNLSTLSKFRNTLLSIAEIEKDNREINRQVKSIRTTQRAREYLIEKIRDPFTTDADRDIYSAQLKKATLRLRDIRNSLILARANVVENMRGVTNGAATEGLTVEQELRNMARSLESDSSKGFGVGQAKNFLDAMETSGQRSFIFALPSIMPNIEMIDGKARVGFDYDSSTYVLMPDAQMLKNLGVEFGSFIADELKYTMMLSTGFAPGTTMSMIRDQMAINRAMGKHYIDINPEDLEKIKQYWTAAGQMTHLLTMSASGTISKRAFANENRLPGVVTTAVSSFQVPNNMAVIARAGLERHGLVMNPMRESTVQSLNAIIDKGSNLEDNWNRDLLERTNRARAKRGQSLLTSEQWIRKGSPYLMAMRSQVSGLTRGVSKEFVDLLVNVRTESQRLDRLMSDASYTHSTQSLEQLNKNIKELKKAIRQHKPKDEGDRFAYSAAIAEVDYWRNRLVLKELELKGSNNFDDRDKKRQANSNEIITRLKRNTPWVLEGFQIGSEYNSSRGRNEGSNRFLRRIEVKELENSSRGRAGIASFDNELFDSLTTGDLAMSKADKNRLFMTMIETKIRSYRAIQNQIRSRQIDPITNIESSSISSIEKIIRVMERELELIRNGSTTLANAQGSINRSIALHNTMNLSEAFITRSAPPGGMEHQRQMFTLIHEMQQLNEAGGDRTFNRDTDRNKTLTVINPLSQITMALGDLDGDPYTAIFAGIADMASTSEKIGHKLNAIDIKLSSLRSQLDKVNNSISANNLFDYLSGGNLYGGILQPRSRQESIRLYGVARSSKSDSELIKERDQYIEHINKLEAMRVDSLARQSHIDLKIRAANDMLRPDSYNKALRKDTANYMGLNLNLFQSSDDVRIDSALFDMDVAILPTLIEQGSGLYSGIEAAGPKIARIRKILEDVIPNRERDLQGIVQIRRDTDDLNTVLHTLADNRDNPLHYIMLDEANRDLADQLAIQIEAEFSDASILSESDYEKGMNNIANRIYQDMTGTKEIQGKMGQAAGITLDYSTYDFITKVLGKAGGELLGKTYNTLIGSVYADTGLVALAHSLGLDGSEAEGSVHSEIRNSIRDGIGVNEADTMFAFIRQGYDRASATQGFMKNIHQLLRDSIKFKSDKGNLQEELVKKSQEYEKASPEDKEKILMDITSQLGPGPGLSAILNLNNLIVKRDELAQADVNSIRSSFGMNLHDLDSDTHGFEAYKNELARLSNRDIDSISTLDVINYKVSEDFKDLVASYRYEKYVESGKSGEILSSGYIEKKALTLDEGLRNRYGNSGYIQDERITDASALINDINSNPDIRSRVDSVVERDLNNWYRDLNINQKRRISVMSNDKAFSEMSLQDKAVVRSLIEQERIVSNSFMGHHGELMDKFVTISQVRMNATGVMDATRNIDRSFQEADMAMTMLNLATQDKLTPEAQATFFQTMVSNYSLDIDPFDKSKYEGDEEGYKAARKEYENNVKRKILTSLMGVDTIATTVGRDRNKDEFKTAFDTFLDKELKIGNATYESGLEFILQQTESTALGQRAGMIEQILSAENKYKKKHGKGRSIEEIATSWLGDDPDPSTLYDLMGKLSQLNLDAKAPAIERYKKMSQDRQAKYKEILEKDYRIVETEIDKANKASNTLDFLGPIAATLIGGAIMSGGITEDHIAELAGASVMSLAYGAQSFKAKSAYAVAGGAFKMAAATEQTGSVEEGFQRYIAQETAFALGAVVLAPQVDRIVNSVIARGIDPALKYNDAIRKASNSISPLENALNSNTVLDVDRYKSTKAISGAVNNAILSAVLGMTAAAVVGEMVAAPTRVKTNSAIDIAIESLGNTIRQSMAMSVDMEEGYEYRVEDEMGVEDIDNERETSAVDYIYANAIDPLEDFSYIHFDAPPFVMVGISLTSEEV